MKLLSLYRNFRNLLHISRIRHRGYVCSHNAKLDLNILADITRITHECTNITELYTTITCWLVAGIVE